MSLSFVPLQELKREDLLALEQSLVRYYKNPPASYYATADGAAENYSPAVQPYHCDLVSRVRPGDRVLELGCGTAHLCPHIQTQGGTYTGLDHSPELLEANRHKFPDAHFLPVTDELHEQFDLVASLYTIEHVVDPKAYLERLWRLARPGGLIAIICPEFIDSPGLPPSLTFGQTARRLREKIQHFNLVDAAEHLLDLQWRGPRWKRRAQSGRPGAFWINRHPRVLEGAPYAIDADAVHLVRLADLVTWFEQNGASIVCTSRTLSEIPPAVAAFNAYVVAQKPSQAPIDLSFAEVSTLDRD